MLVDPEAGEEEGETVLALGSMPALSKTSGIWLAGEVDVDTACQVCCHIAAELILDD